MTTSVHGHWDRWPTTMPDSWPDTNEPSFVVVDLETTGLSPMGDRIIEIALIRTDLDGIPVGTWSQLVNPRRPVGASEIHGITADQLTGAPTFAEIADEVVEKLRGALLVAHNAQFDRSFLASEMTRSGWKIPDEPTLCTMVESAHFLPGLSRKRLGDCVEAIGFGGEVLHRALSDATLAAALLFFYLNGPMNQERSGLLRDLGLSAQRASWPLVKDLSLIDTSTPSVIVYRARPKAVSKVAGRVSEVMPEDLLDKDATVAELSYCARLLESIEDGEIDEREEQSLADLYMALKIDDERVGGIHQRLLWALAFEAWHDGVVNREEQREVIRIAQQIGLSESDARICLNDVEQLRKNRVAARSLAIPEDLDLGEPVRVGDRVVFTGCYDDGRDEMEDQARRRGLRVTGSVSGRTNLLVTDGTINGIKEREASRLGVRKVGPSQFRTLLEFVQPEHASPKKSVPTQRKQVVGTSIGVSGEVQIEKLVCLGCGSTFERTITRGRKPHFCLECRS